MDNMLITTSDTPSHFPLRIITYNIRFATSHPAKHEKLWVHRGPLLCAQLQFITTDHPSAFICLQEALAHQVNDVLAALGPEWSHIGVGRDDGVRRGEFSPILYRPASWRCDGFRTFWLSETPDVPSRGWDAALPRIVTVGEFVSREHGTKAVVMCTHFDHKGAVARLESARLLLGIAAGVTGGERADVVLLGGDFNSDPKDDAYRAMVEHGSGMKDIRDLAPRERRYGNEITYTSFDEPQWDPSRIDFLFLGDGSEATVRNFGVLANRFDDGVFLSDHRPVVADLEVPVRRQ